MGFILLVLLASTLAYGLQVWLKRWWVAGFLPLLTYFAYVWIDLHILPFHTGGFPGWESVLAIGALIVVPASAAGIWAARLQATAEKPES